MKCEMRGGKGFEEGMAPLKTPANIFGSDPLYECTQFGEEGEPNIGQPRLCRALMLSDGSTMAFFQGGRVVVISPDGAAFAMIGKEDHSTPAAFPDCLTAHPMRFAPSHSRPLLEVALRFRNRYAEEPCLPYWLLHHQYFQADDHSYLAASSACARHLAERILTPRNSECRKRRDGCADKISLRSSRELGNSAGYLLWPAVPIQQNKDTEVDFKADTAMKDFDGTTEEETTFKNNKFIAFDERVVRFTHNLNGNASTPSSNDTNAIVVGHEPPKKATRSSEDIRFGMGVEVSSLDGRGHLRLCPLGKRIAVTFLFAASARIDRRLECASDYEEDKGSTYGIPNRGIPGEDQLQPVIWGSEASSRLQQWDRCGMLKGCSPLDRIDRNDATMLVVTQLHSLRKVPPCFVHPTKVAIEAVKMRKEAIFGRQHPCHHEQQHKQHQKQTDYLRDSSSNRKSSFYETSGRNVNIAESTTSSYKRLPLPRAHLPTPYAPLARDQGKTNSNRNLAIRKPLPVQELGAFLKCKSTAGPRSVCSGELSNLRLVPFELITLANLAEHCEDGDREHPNDLCQMEPTPEPVRLPARLKTSAIPTYPIGVLCLCEWTPAASYCAFFSKKNMKNSSSNETVVIVEVTIHVDDSMLTLEGNYITHAHPGHVEEKVYHTSATGVIRIVYDEECQNDAGGGNAISRDAPSYCLGPFTRHAIAFRDQAVAPRFQSTPLASKAGVGNCHKELSKGAIVSQEIAQEIRLPHCTLTAFCNGAVRGTFSDRSLITLHRLPCLDEKDGIMPTTVMAAAHNCRIVTTDGNEIFLTYPPSRQEMEAPNSIVDSNFNIDDATNAILMSSQSHLVHYHGYARHLRLLFRFSRWIFAPAEQQAEASLQHQASQALITRQLRRTALFVGQQQVAAKVGDIDKHQDDTISSKEELTKGKENEKSDHEVIAIKNSATISSSPTQSSSILRHQQSQLGKPCGSVAPYPSSSSSLATGSASTVISELTGTVSHVDSGCGGGSSSSTTSSTIDGNRSICGSRLIDACEDERTAKIVYALHLNDKRIQENLNFVQS